MNNKHSLYKFEKFSGYISGFNEAVEKLKIKISEKQYKTLLNDKLRLEKGDTDINQTIQSLCELSICAYFSTLEGKFEYEPKREGRKNPEISWEINNFCYNIEVKCPNYSIQEEKTKANYLQLKTVARYPWYKSEVPVLLDGLKELFKNFGNVTEESRTDDKLFDFLKSASEKFTKFSNSNDINILILCCDDEDDLNDYYNHLYSSSGFFTTNSYRNPEEFKNVDLILLTNLRGLHNINFQYLTNLGWNFERVFKLLFKNPQCQKYISEGIDLISKRIPNYNHLFIPFFSMTDNVLATNSVFRLKAFILEEIVAKGNGIIPNYTLRRYIA
jgi:hypothetical protein